MTIYGIFVIRYKIVFRIYFQSYLALLVAMIRIVAALTGIALSSDPGNYLTPLRYNSEGRPVVKVLGPGGNSYYLNMTSGRHMSLPCEVDDETGPVGISFKHHELGMDSYSFVQVPGGMCSFQTGYPHMGIGPATAVTIQAGPISVIRGSRSATLALYSTLDYFKSACKPDTLVSFRSTLPVSLSLKNDTLVESFGSRRLTFGAIMVYRASVPREMFFRLEEFFFASGLSRTTRLIGKYSHCTAEKVSSIPNLELNYGFGTFVIRPEEFIKLKEDGICYSLLWPASEDETLFVEPLLLLDKNIRVSKDHTWDFCESSAVI